MFKYDMCWYGVVSLLVILVGPSLVSCKSSATTASEGSGDTAEPSSVTGPVVPRGQRIIAIAVTAAKGDDYDAAYKLAKSVGMEDAALLQNWSGTWGIEAAPGVYQNDTLRIANDTYTAYGLQLNLTVTPIHTNVNVMPDDLKDKPLNDPEVIQRFTAMLDYVLTQLPTVALRSMVLCSEFDALFGSDLKRYQELEEFFIAASQHLKAKRPGIKVAIEPTLPALIGYAQEPLKRINQYTDIIGVSYYPLNDDMTAKPPSVVREDIAALVALYPGRTIYFYQIGYPSGAGVNSSQQQQAEFIREAFKAWDRHASQIQLMCFTWLHDVDSASVVAMADFYGGSGYQTFVEFLATIGLRTYEGKDKEAFRVLTQEAKARGWSMGKRSMWW